MSERWRRRPTRGSPGSRGDRNEPHRCLTFAEREEIALAHAAGQGVRMIAEVEGYLAQRYSPEQIAGRAIWSGDLKIEGQGIAGTLGSNGDDYVKQSLLTLITNTPPGSGLYSETLFPPGWYSNSCSSWTLDAATTYYCNTGDNAFAEQILPWLVGQLGYDATLTGSNGLIVTSSRIGTAESRTSLAHGWRPVPRRS